MPINNDIVQNEENPYARLNDKSEVKEKGRPKPRSPLSIPNQDVVDESPVAKPSEVQIKTEVKPQQTESPASKPKKENNKTVKSPSETNKAKDDKANEISDASNLVSDINKNFMEIIDIMRKKQAEKQASINTIETRTVDENGQTIITREVVKGGRPKKYKDAKRINLSVPEETWNIVEPVFTYMGISPSDFFNFMLDIMLEDGRDQQFAKANQVIRESFEQIK